MPPLSMSGPHRDDLAFRGQILPFGKTAAGERVWAVPGLLESMYHAVTLPGDANAGRAYGAKKEEAPLNFHQKLNYTPVPIPRDYEKSNDVTRFMQGFQNTALADKFNTPLSRQEQAEYYASDIANQTYPGADAIYDLQGAWKGGADFAGNGHLPDTWKKPNHPTFAKFGKYSNADSGAPGAWINDGNGWVFKAGSANLKYYTPEQLAEYFRIIEPTSVLQMPLPPIVKDHH